MELREKIFIVEGNQKNTKTLTFFGVAQIKSQ